MQLIEPYLRLMADKNASDIYFLTGAPPHMRVEGETLPISKQKLAPGQTRKLAYSLMSEQQVADFERTHEMNLGVSIPGVGRYRVNVFVQRSEPSLVIRYIKSTIPSFEELNLPPVVPELVMKKTGLVLVVGSTGSGKSTTLAAMIAYRAAKTSGHILTVEDPIEYAFSHQRALVSQREVGVDTLSYENALREAMREAPDVIMIGEIRDRETMQAAIAYADTGHLCLSTLHAVNANQALDRIINMFPNEAKNQIFMDLSLNLRGIISQRLVTGADGKRLPAVEVMVNTPFVGELVKKGEISEIKSIMEKGAAVGMQSFDQSLYDLYKHDKINLQDALANADSSSDLEWKINFGGGARSLNKTTETDALELPSEIEARERARRKGNG